MEILTVIGYRDIPSRATLKSKPAILKFVEYLTVTFVCEGFLRLLTSNEILIIILKDLLKCIYSVRESRLIQL